MIDWVNSLFRTLAGVVRAFGPQNLRKVAARVPLYAPLATRSLRRRLLRNLLVGLCLGAGIIVYLGLAASFRGAAVDVAGKTENLVLPADVLVFGTRLRGGQPLKSLKFVSQARASEVFDRWQAETSLGTRWVLGLAGDSRLWAGLGDTTPSGPGEVLVPSSLAEPGRLQPGSTVHIGLVGPSGFSGRGFRVAGIFGADGATELFRDTVVVRLEDLLSLRGELEAVVPVGRGQSPASEGPNSVAIWERDPGDRRRLVGRVRGLFPGATMWWPELPAHEAYRAVGGVLSPGNLVLILVFVLAGLGVFNVMLLSLLQRKVQLGVLKALGAEDDEVFLLLVLEGSFLAAGGTLLGLLGGVGLVRILDRASQVPLVLTGSSLVWAVALAVASFYLAAWLPATLCRRARPTQLMAGRRLYLNPRSTCAQCGRCGGF